MAMQKSEVTQAHLEFLDELRSSGETNMFGAAPYVAREFGIPLADARMILTEWMGSFGARHPNGT